MVSCGIITISKVCKILIMQLVNLLEVFLFPDSPMPEIVRLLGRYDCFGHKGTDEEFKVLEFQYGARSRINDVQSAYYNLQKVLLIKLDKSYSNSWL